MTADVIPMPPSLPGSDHGDAQRKKMHKLVSTSQGSTKTLGALTINRDERGIAVSPPEVVFEDVRAGLLFVLTFAVQNVSGEMRRIRVVPPRTPVFCLNYEPVGGLAPGLDVRAEVEFQLPAEDETEDLRNPFRDGEVGEYTDKFIVISGNDKVEVPLLARRPAPTVVHELAVEFGTVSDEKKSYGTVSLANTGSRKATWSIKWDKALPLAFSPSQGILDEGRSYRDAEAPTSTLASDPSWAGSTEQIEVTFDATKWSTSEPFRALATLAVPGQEETVMDLSATVCTQKLRLLGPAPDSVSELSTAEFGTLHYGCKGEIKGVLFNDGPEQAPFMTAVEVEGVQGGGRGGGGGGGDGEKSEKRYQLPFEVEPRDGTIVPYGRQEIAIRFHPSLSPRLSGFKGEGCSQEPLPTEFRGKVLLEHAERKSDAVIIPVSGKGVRPTVSVTQKVVRFGSCSCYERRDVVVGIKNTSELPVRFTLSKAPNFSCTPSKGLLQPMQSQNAVLSFCPAQLGHFRAVLNFSLSGNALVLPIRVIGEAITVGIKQPRPGGIDKLPADFKPKFNFVLSESASGLRKAAERKGAWHRPKPFETVDLLASNSWDSDVHTPGDVGGVDETFGRLTFSMQGLAQREQDRRDADAWLTVQRLKRANREAEKEAIRRAKAQGKDWKDPEAGVEMGMNRWLAKDEPSPKLPPAQNDPLFLLKPLDGRGKAAGATDIQADMNKLITRKFKQTPATQAEARDCATAVGRDQLAKVELHFRTLDFGQVTVGSANVRNLAVTNHLPHSVLAELVGLEGQEELIGSGPPAQVVPAGATAGFDVHFKCQTEQMYRKALKLAVNRGAVHQFSLLAITVPVSIDLGRDEVTMEFPTGSLDATLRHPLTLTNEGNAIACYSWTTRGVFAVSPEKGTIGPRGEVDAEVIWTPQPGCSAAETLVLKVEGGQGKALIVSGKLPEARCRFVPPGPRDSANAASACAAATATNPHNETTTTNNNGIHGAAGSISSGEAAAGVATSGVLDFGRISVGVEVTRTVVLQNTGKSQAAFFVDTSDLIVLGINVQPTRGLIEPRQSCTLTLVLRAPRELRLDGSVLLANVRGGRPAKISLGGYARIPEVSLAESSFDFGEVTAGDCESMPGTLFNHGLIPASLLLDLSQLPEFHLEEAKALPPTIGRGLGVAGRGEGEENHLTGIGREVSRIEQIESFDGESHTTPPSLSSSTGGSGYLSTVRQWRVLVAAGDSFHFHLVYRPERPGAHDFQLPLSLEGIPPERATRLRVPVTAAGLQPTLTFLSTEVDFGRKVVNRDLCSLKQYQGEFVLRNASDKGLCWVMDDAYLRETGPEAEGIVGAGMATPQAAPDNNVSSDGPVTPALYVSPTAGRLCPGEESRLRLTFTPKRAGVLSFSLPVWLADRVPEPKTRPYLKLRVHGVGVYPCLSFSRSPVELPVVPLLVTSRAMFHVANAGFSDMEVSFRLPQHCSVDLAVAFPEGRQLGAGLERLLVEISFKSSKPVCFSCVLDMFDADGGHYPLPIRGCADNCLLTNSPFVRAYRHKFKFWAREGKSVQFMNDAQINAQEAKDFKDRQSKRARSKARNANDSTATYAQDASGGASGTQSPLTGAGSEVAPSGAAAFGVMDHGINAGVDLSEAAYANGADEAGSRVLCAWLNANVATTYMEHFPTSILEMNGRPALEAIETMSGRKVPGQSWRKISPAGGGRAEDRVPLLMEQYRQMLRFLVEKGCLLNSVRPEDLLDRVDSARFTTSTDGGVSGGGTHGSIPQITVSSPSHDDMLHEDEWIVHSREAWMTVMYQCIRTFMLARVTPRALSALPGVFIVMPTRKGEAKGGGGKAEIDPELANSNVLSVGEGVLLKWLSYHLEQASKTCMPKRVATFSDDLKDAAILCQAVASHVPHFTEKGGPLHGFIPVHSTGELSDRSNRELNASKFLMAMSKLRIDFGLDVDGILDISDRDGVLLALHLFQALPQMIPKTEIEFRAHLGAVVSKSIELKNPSSKAIMYDVTLEGSPDFRANGTQVHLDGGKEAEFIVELLPRFSSPVEARLTFWAARNKGGMAPASSMVFRLKSKVESVEPVSVTNVEGKCYEPHTIVLDVANPFEASSRGAADGRFTVRLAQAMVSEHPAVAGLTGGGRRGSAMGPGGARRRASSVAMSCVPPKGAMGTVAGEGGKRAGEAEGWKKKAQHAAVAASIVRVTSVAGDEMKGIRTEVETALKLPFHTDQESISIPGSLTAKLSLLFLPFSPGEYKCTIMFWNERLGEFAQEIKATVGLPLPAAELAFRVTTKDGGGGGSGPVQRDLLLPSRNAALQNALLGVLLDRIGNEAVLRGTQPSGTANPKPLSLNCKFSSDRKTRARQAMISICSDSPQDASSVSSQAATEEAAMFVLEVDSPFFQLGRESVLLASEPLGAGGGGGTAGVGAAAGTAGNATARNNTARGAPGTSGGAKNRNLPKKVELLDPTSRGSHGHGRAGDPRGQTAAAAEGGDASGGDPSTLPATNAAVLNFFPRAAGTYPCRVLVKRRTKYLVDVRCVDIAAAVEAPRNATALVFRAPAGQKITQEIPIHNNGEVSWTLNAGPRQPPFGGPNQLTVPPRGVAAYPLTFSPLRMSEEEFLSKLVLSDLRDKNKPVKFEFDLRGTAEEPLAEGHRIVRCSARERVEQSFTLRNSSAKDVEYTVDSDLPRVSGSPGFIVPAKGEAEYRLSICPQFGGVFTGSLTFTALGGINTWYTVEIQASNPLEEDVVAISTVLRQAVSVEISLSNPLDKDLRFQVSLRGEGLLGDSIFSLAPNASSTYTLYYSPLRVQSHSGSITFAADAVGEFWYRLELRADPCPPVRLDEISCPVGASRGLAVSIDNPVGREIVLFAKTSNASNFAAEPTQVPIAPYGTANFQVVYTPSSLGQTESGEITLAHAELGDWVFEASGVGEMPGVMEEHRVVAVVGLHASTMFPFRNPFPEPLLLTVVFKPSEEHTDQVVTADARGGMKARKPKRGMAKQEGSMTTTTVTAGRGEGRGRAGRSPFVLLLRKATDLVLQPFQSLQIPLSFSPEVIMETRACVEVRGQLGGRSLTWVFPIVGAGEAPGGLKVFSLACPAKSSVREVFEVELVGLAGVEKGEEFAFEVALPEDPSLKRLLERALSVVPITTTLSHPKELLKFQLSLEPLKPFQAIVEVVVKRKTGGGRWRYEVKVEATEAPPDDTISLRAAVGGQSSAVFRLCNRYLGYAPFQAYFTTDSALSLSVEPTDGVLTPFGTEGTAVTITYAPTRYALSQKGRLIVETDDIRWSYAVTGDFPAFRAPTDVVSKVDTGSHAGSRSNATNLPKGTGVAGGGGREGYRRINARLTSGGGSGAGSVPSWRGGDGMDGFGDASDAGRWRGRDGIASPKSQSSAGGRGERRGLGG